MTAAIAAPLARAQKLAAAAATIAVIAAVMLGLTAALDMFAPGLRQLRTAGPGWEGVSDITRIVGAHFLLALPSFLLAGACFDLSGVLGEYAEGRFFTPRAAAGVRKAGEGILYAMLFQCVLSPTLYSIVSTSGEGRAFTVKLETFDLGLIALGFFVMVMGRVLQAAAAIKAENDEIV